MASPTAVAHRGYVKPTTAIVSRTQCDQLRQQAEKNQICRFVVPKKSGAAWKLYEGQTCRFELNEGAQVGDVNLWCLQNTKERFFSGKTRQLHSAHLTIGDRLWSCLPYLRPMATVIGDSLHGYTPDQDGMGVHDVMGTRCDPYIHKLITGELAETSCHQILTNVIKDYGLKEHDVHDVFNIFMCTGLHPATHEYQIKATPARKGDYIEIVADMDLLVALSVCPQGDVSQPVGEPVPDNLCHSMEIIIGNARDAK